MSKYKNNRKHIIRAVIVSLCTFVVLAAAFAVNIFAADEVEYIYFDLAAGNVTINASTYSGYIYAQGSTNPVPVTGTHSSGNHYYVYQSTSENRASTGRIDGKIVLPTYERVTYNGESWGDYITNHPGDTNASTDDEAVYDGSASVKRVIEAWEEAVSGKRTSTGNKITFSGNVGNVELVIDNIWSHYQEVNQSRLNGAICYNASGYNNNNITIKLKGDNRVPNIFYRTYGAANEPEFDKTYDNKMIFDVYDDTTATLTVADNRNYYGGNFWNAAIGSSDSNDACKGLVFNNGVIYAGTTSTDDCTAIGGGGNGAATITINGGTITAVASTSGSTIGGGIGKSAQGGSADITIAGGTIYSYNFGYGYGSQEITDGGFRDRSSDSYIVSSAIGGGSSYSSAGCKYAFVNISGGTVYAQSVGGTAIGGGSSITKNGGSTEITISGGTVTAKSVAGRLYDNSKDKYVDIIAGVAIGGGTGNASGGSAELTVSGDAVLHTGSIGGGGYTATSGTIGSANVTINGGTIQGQVVMEGEGSKFNMSAGTINNANAANAGYAFKEDNGGAVCVKTGIAEISGGAIQNCVNTGNLGGAIYLSNGTVIINGGVIQNCEALNGGAVYVAGGDFSMNGGTLTGNTAEQSGGAVYVNNGNVKMKGGIVSANKAIGNDGGAFYVSSNGATVSVIVQTGEISGNSSSGNGGAIAVVGVDTDTVNVNVQIGVNELHFDENTYQKQICEHNDDNKIDEKDTCPIVKNNTSGGEGGAIYITGSDTTDLNIYCIDEAGNRGGGNSAGSEETMLSDFLKVDGGNVLISAVQTGTENVYYGNSVINSSIHVTGGNLTLSGAMANPVINAPITVDVTEAGGSYTDDRENVTGQDIYYKIQYYENFTDEETQITTGQYTVYQVKEDTQHTIWGVIYSHTGYTIVGWNENKDEETASHTPGQTINMTEDLTLYAIWSSNVYYIVYDANVPTGTPVIGTMEKQVLSCATPDKLTPNAYVYAGRIFLGWSETQNATTATYTDGALVEPLRDEYGETVTLYAIWKVCDHTGAEKYTYSADGDTLTCTCACTYYITATIKGNPGVYAPNTSHPASIVFGASNPEDEGGAKAFTYENVKIGEYYLKTLAEQSIQYEKKNAENTYDNAVATAPMNAGTYKASSTLPVGNGESYAISVEYIIDKAQQTPPSKPVFTVDKTTSTLTVGAISNSKETGNSVKFKLIYGVSDGWAETPVEKWDNTGVFALSQEWTTYFVRAYYPGNDNYEDSAISESDMRLFYANNIEVFVQVDEGMTYTANTSGAFKVTIKPKDDLGYYIPSTFTQIVTETVDGEQIAATSNLLVDTNDRLTFTLANVSTIDGTEKTITITFSGAKLIATVTPSVVPNEEFGEVVNTETKIANDSAFTSYFEVNHYEGYSDLALNFNTALPVGTTIIMVDKTEGTYWYTKVETATNTFALTSFKKMGDGTVYEDPTKTTLKYQFIVDFSDVESNSITSLTANLMATEDKSDYVPTLSSKGISVIFAEVTSDLTAGTDNTITVTYPKSEGVASKWEEREGTLVLTPAEGVTLPIDISLEVAEIIGGTTKTTVYYLNEKGQFIVPFSSEATNVTFTLKSNMFASTEYKFSVAMYASYVDKAPFGGINIKTMNEISLTATVESKPSASITGIRKLFEEHSGEDLNVTVQIKSAGYKYEILLMRKGVDGKYSATGWSHEETDTNTNTTDGSIKTINVSLALNEAYDKGSYCIAVVVKNSENTTILSVPYYFIIK